MRWIKPYKYYNESLEGTIHPLFFYISTGSGDYRGVVLKDEVIQKVNKFNEVFKYVGISISMPQNFDKSPYYPCGENFQFTVTINLTSIKPPGQPDTFNTIFYNYLENYAKQLGITSGIASSNLITNVTKDLVQFTVTFSINRIDNKEQFLDSNGKNLKVHYTRQINKHTLNDFIKIITGCLYEYLTKQGTYHVRLNLNKIGNKFTSLEKPFFIKTIVRCLAQSVDLTKEKVGEIFFKQASDDKDCNTIFYNMKETEWYPMFQQLGGNELVKSDKMKETGFND